jgi:hypothetical protein
MTLQCREHSLRLIRQLIQFAHDIFVDPLRDSHAIDLDGLGIEKPPCHRTQRHRPCPVLGRSARRLDPPRFKAPETRTALLPGDSIGIPPLNVVFIPRCGQSVARPLNVHPPTKLLFTAESTTPAKSTKTPASPHAQWTHMISRHQFIAAHASIVQTAAIRACPRHNAIRPQTQSSAPEKLVIYQTNPRSCGKQSKPPKPTGATIGIYYRPALGRTSVSEPNPVSRTANPSSPRQVRDRV